ncbi:hypothetical protein [Poseidonocella sp. HB161398]|uniref:hypothetical protein n=1 Tax=Poseidonocella sp. HB161398 TaxID=2320855 RepID=UPI00110905C5|nr:hypothetical protein [Poseidonocella sp. HB161398]
MAENVRKMWPELSLCLLCDASPDPHGPAEDPDTTVIDYLQVPENAAELFCSAIGFLRHRLKGRTEPLVMAFNEGILGCDAAPATGANAVIRTGFGAGDRLSWLQIDAVTASGPLLPAFAGAVRPEGLSDRQFAELLTAGFDG